jgi:TM2 domain-containing membrane protein YozV
MSKWKDIARLSDQEAKKREAAFEAEMLSTLAPGRSQPPAAPHPPIIPIRDGIQISVSENGHTTNYTNLETVPLSVRQRIMSVWLSAPRPGEQVPQATGAQLPLPPTPRKKSLRFAMTLNLLVPGLGQFYFGQPIMGSVYAIGFIACFVTILAKFMSAYYQYLQLSTSGDILQTGNLEQLAHAFPAGTLTGLTIVSIVIYLVSSIHLALSHRHK